MSHGNVARYEHRRGGGVGGNYSAARAKAANAPHCRQAFAVQYSGVKLIALPINDPFDGLIPVAVGFVVVLLRIF
jgi:hypothetical protein